MKAIEKLIQLRKEHPSIVAIAKDRSKNEYWFHSIPEYNYKFGEWENSDSKIPNGFLGYNSLDFGTDVIHHSIVTLNDLENYEVKMMSISVQEYERLLEAEKKLKEIQKFFI